MTNKRFTIDKDGITVIDNCTDELFECKYSNEAKLLGNLLNELHEENMKLVNINIHLCQSIEEDMKVKL